MSNKFAETVKGKIVIGVLIACIVGVLGHVSGRLVAPILPPNARISPEMITVDAGQVVEFNAAESSDPKSNQLTYDWKISGHRIHQSSVGHCNHGTELSLVACVFVAPGTFSVSVIATNSSGLSSTATSPVTVLLKNGFVGLFLNLGESVDERDDAYRLILQAIDWPTVQKNVSRPIILYDPDLRAPVYAASVTHKSDSEIDQNIIGSFGGRSLIVPNFRKEAMDIIRKSIRELGGTVIVSYIADIPPALTAGRSNSGFASVSSFKDFRSTLDTGEFR